MELHRTDCINCRKRIYHPSIGGYRPPPRTGEIQFTGVRPRHGTIWYHGPTEHHILNSEDGDIVIATCIDYWNLSRAFTALEDLVERTSRIISAKLAERVPF